MIRVDRDRPDPRSAEATPIQPSAAWFELAERATETALDEAGEHKIKAHVYGHDEVRMALEELFHDKCAYCEGAIGETASWDVEHYRPKGRVEERSDHPGYYWLAYSWSNLYPSCELCNRRRKDPPRRNDPRRFPAKGKGDRFPLENEEARAMTPHDELAAERPLLLDPCDPEDDPEDHFTYGAEGQIHPLRDGDQRAQTTIDICHLQRRRLQEARRKVLAWVISILKLLEEPRVARDDSMSGRINQLLEDRLADRARFSGVARALVRNAKVTVKAR